MTIIPVECYSMAEAAIQLRVSKPRISAIVKSGRLEPIVLGNRHFFIKEQIDEFSVNPNGRPLKPRSGAA